MRVALHMHQHRCRCRIALLLLYDSEQSFSSICIYVGVNVIVEQCKRSTICRRGDSSGNHYPLRTLAICTTKID
ncbi:hypothetical protein GW17_00021989 [Ensete ventricosum]|nr:hypothetical protein GW17_00021989 [Ensete ventricosum]